MGYRKTDNTLLPREHQLALELHARLLTLSQPRRDQISALMLRAIGALGQAGARTDRGKRRHLDEARHTLVDVVSALGMLVAERHLPLDAYVELRRRVRRLLDGIDQLKKLALPDWRRRLPTADDAPLTPTDELTVDTLRKILSLQR